MGYMYLSMVVLPGTPRPLLRMLPPAVPMAVLPLLMVKAVITVKGDATATGTGGIGAMANSSGWVTVKGNVTTTADNIFMDGRLCSRGSLG